MTLNCFAKQLCVGDVLGPDGAVVVKTSPHADGRIAVSLKLPRRRRSTYLLDPYWPLKRRNVEENHQ